MNKLDIQAETILNNGFYRDEIHTRIMWSQIKKTIYKEWERNRPKVEGYICEECEKTIKELLSPKQSKAK